LNLFITLGKRFRGTLAIHGLTIRGKSQMKRGKTHFKGRYTLDIFTHNIAIKRYCNKKIFFHPIFIFLCVFPVCIEKISLDKIKQLKDAKGIEKERKKEKKERCTTLF